MAKFSEIVNDEVPVLVDFFATWCGPCQTMMPVLEQLKKELGDEVKIIKVDVDKNKPLATQFNVRGVPAFLIFKNGKQVWRGGGVQPISDLRHQIQNA
ncbi:thioredoxin [Nonlabens sp. Hel1_33_55]|uniref:thioredoxin n=1 Tax=Nonlabens sp. Hel1_33_55 TaxID=1336802 RepID=UPI000875D27D|nr:thioredoxin [Nonlabens sp. Hel1_33_55]SCY28409.1 thioredoxin [Nonlabens sp. Hel1_33_55]